MINYLYIILALVTLYCLYAVYGATETFEKHDFSQYDLVEVKIDRWGKKNGKWRAHVTVRGGGGTGKCIVMKTKGFWVETPGSTDKPKDEYDFYLKSWVYREVYDRIINRSDRPGNKFRVLGKNKSFTCKHPRGNDPRLINNDHHDKYKFDGRYYG